MKKLQKPMLEYFENFNIYLEDLRDMIQILETAEADSIKIIVNYYELENIEKLSDEKLSKIEMLEIKSRNPYVSITYNGNRISLYIDEDNFKNIGVYNELKNVIIKTQNHKLLKIRKVIEKLLFLPAGMYFGYRLNNDKFKSFDIYFLVYTAIVILYSFNPYKGKGDIYNYDVKNKINFWLRNRDNIIVSTISLMLGSLFTVIIQNIF